MFLSAFIDRLYGILPQTKIRPFKITQHSRPTRVLFPASVGWLMDSGNGVNQSIANFKLGGMNQKAISIVVNARGPQIHVSVRK